MKAATRAEENRKLQGSRVEDLDTPALLLDWAVAERNIRRMADFFHGRSCRLRPHFKNHKCPTLAWHQLDAGNAVGMTCAKLGEAEVLAAHGFENVLIANQIVGRAKVKRLVELAKKVQVMVAIDDLIQATQIAEAASAAKAAVGVLIEIDIGMGRCGLPPGKPTLELARQIEKMPGLRFAGLQAYEGHVVYTNDFDHRAELTRLAFHSALQTRDLLESDGIPVLVVSGGSSATYQVAAQIDGINEIQAGTYATMDWRYAELSPEFEVALTILARVISKRPGVAVLDVGAKGIGTEFGPPRVKDHPDVDIAAVLTDEHCIVRHAPHWRIGDALHLLPSHACTTCNLYRDLYIHENGRVVDVWPIEASGKLT